MNDPQNSPSFDHGAMGVYQRLLREAAEKLGTTNSDNDELVLRLLAASIPWDQRQGARHILQTFDGLPLRKLSALMADGWHTNGVSIRRVENGITKQGAVTLGGMVLWWNQEQPAPDYKDSTPHLSVGESSFESWYDQYLVSAPVHQENKQRLRDAYAAGMGDQLVTAAPVQQEPIYQSQDSTGKWTDQEKHSYDYNVKHGHATVRVVYPCPRPPQQIKPEHLLALLQTANQELGKVIKVFDMAAPVQQGTVWTLEECKKAMDALNYIQGIAERGEGRKMRDDEPLEQFVLGYVKKLEQPTQPNALPFGIGGGLTAIKTLLSRDPCAHATTAIQMLDAILAGQLAHRACTWTPSGDPNEPGTWAASCGAMWTFTDGGPVENDVHYCHKCGGALQIEGADDASA